ncbi:MAG TPA: hypothetical protein VFH70_08855 [Acidimicrobiales bacterium]|nr:hypothetical protein [Acidimicrobiales bacterium]
MATPNPYAGTGDEEYWAQGYEAGQANPKALFPKPPAVLNDEGSTVWKEGWLAGKDDANEAAKAPPPAASSTPAEPAHEMQHTGAAATEEPATFAIHGQPAYRYNLPNIPIAEAEFDTGEALVTVALSLRGNVTITFEDPVKWASLDQSGVRVEATKALGPLTEGLRISGMPDNPSLGVTMGSQYDLTETRFVPPDTVMFIGQARVGYTVDTAAGHATVQGQPGAEVKVTILPHPTESPAPASESYEDFKVDHKAVWEAVAVGAAIAFVAIALAPETGGASLVALAAI